MKPTLHHAAILAATLCLSVACGGQTSGSSATGGQAGTGGGSGGSSASGGSSGTGATSGTGGTGATSGTGGTNGGSCTPNQPCASDEYCDYPDDRCGSGSAGKCVKRPQGCDLMYAPVCACNGVVAGNECSAHSGGYDINANATCTPPAGLFACGTKFCSVGSQYCLRSTSDVGGTPDSFSCGTPPAACGAAPSCACLASEPCGSLCAADPAGNVTLTCPGG